uniref:Uncharacterized protein n=1 Tax=Aegilops tauschii subsp. strangulata TaxID=200361 RepID=A0A453IFZ6_AEGTS
MMMLITFFRLGKVCGRAIICPQYLSILLLICWQSLFARSRRRATSSGGWGVILQYPDDMIIFMKHDMDKSVNMILVLCLFEQLPGLKINFHKSEL